MINLKPGDIIYFPDIDVIASYYKIDFNFFEMGDDYVYCFIHVLEYDMEKIGDTEYIKFYPCPDSWLHNYVKIGEL